MDDKQPDYSIEEIFAEVMADESWEPDAQKRMGAVMGLQFSLYM